MSDHLKKVYYKDWSRRKEVAEAEARASTLWSVRHIDAEGIAHKIELMEGSQAVQVWYAVESVHEFGDVLRRAASEHPGIVTELGLRGTAGDQYKWELMIKIGPDKSVTDYLYSLTDEQGRELLGARFDGNREIADVTKYLWEDGRILYVFEFGKNDECLHIEDLGGGGGSVDMAALRPELEDPKFYESALSLPSTLGPDARMPPIPSLRDLGLEGLVMTS